MQLKTKLAAAGIGTLALSGGAVTTMLSGTASAAPVPTVLTQSLQSAPNTHAAGNAPSGTDTQTGSQSGDQASPDAGAKGSELASSEADGPGGHQEPGTANVNHDFQGQE